MTLNFLSFLLISASDLADSQICNARTSASSAVSRGYLIVSRGYLIVSSFEDTYTLYTVQAINVCKQIHSTSGPCTVHTVHLHFVAHNVMELICICTVLFPHLYCVCVCVCVCCHY